MNKKETGVLYAPPMVAAILANLKTVTRRMNGLERFNENPNDFHFMVIKDEFWAADFTQWPTKTSQIKCPYGKPGDLIWVRESHWAYGYWVKTGTFTDKGHKKWRFVRDATKPVVFGQPDFVNKSYEKHDGWYKRSSLFLPKSDARIWLEIVDIDIQRLQVITDADAVCEGIEQTGESFGEKWFANYGREDIGTQLPARESFRTLWVAINGKESWENNPWVWVIRFKVCECGLPF